MHISDIKSKKVDLKNILEIEKEEHNKFYSNKSRYEKNGAIHFSLQAYEKNMAYPWNHNFDLYSEETLRFVKYIDSFQTGNKPINGPILEYGCGRGDLSCYLALKGWKEVYGFDLSETAIQFGKKLVASCNLQDRVFFQQMNAQSLDYPDDRFFMVVGKGVLHHISKYPGTATELFRIMKPGAVAVFLENLGNGLIWKKIRQHTMGNTDLGDINITTDWLKEWASPFKEMKLKGFHLLFMAKRLFLIREEKTDGFIVKKRRFDGILWLFVQILLSGCYLFDELFINHNKIGDTIGGMCIITLRK